jgi:dTDP-4-dehydrorhamnose reductase
MNILLLGSEGQLGFELVKRIRDLNFALTAPLMADLDIVNREAVVSVAKQTEPNLIINAAAYTAVDQAEEKVEVAFQVNRDGAANAALAASETGSRFIQISTDYVFGGDGCEPIKEDAETRPLGVYGKSKLEGEREIQKLLGQQALIVRTSALHGQNGHNFVHTMLKLFSTRPQVRVVDDQIISPTWAGWLADAVLDLARMDCGGIIHACCDGAVSWYEFAAAILEIARPALKENQSVELIPIPTSEYPTPARRPQYSVMDTSKLSNLLGRKPMSWKDGLRAHLGEIGYPG